MRTAALVLLTFWYLLASSGAELRAHFCCNRLAAVTISLLPEKAACCCQSKAITSCCKTKTAIVKVTEVQQTSQAAFDFFPIIGLKVIINTYIELLQPARFGKHAIQWDPPKRAPLYLLKRVFRI